MSSKRGGAMATNCPNAAEPTQVSNKAAEPPSHVRALPVHLPSCPDGLGIGAFRQSGLLITRPPDPAPASPARPEQKKTGPKPDSTTIYTPGFQPRASPARSQCTSSMLCYRCG